MSMDQSTGFTTLVHESTLPSLNADHPFADLGLRFNKVKRYSLLYSRSSVYGTVAMILFCQNGIC
jgi:hypothetical protein